MKIVDGIEIFNEAERLIISQADNDLEFLKGIKQEFFNFIDGLHRKLNLLEDGDKYLSKADFISGIVAMEESLDEMIMPAWNKKKAEAMSYESLPQSKIVTAYINRNQTATPAVMFAEELKSSRIITNPQSNAWGE